MDYFKRLLELLQIEQAEDLKLYKEQTEGSGIAERRASGLVWYPIAIRGSEMSRGDYITIEAERTTHQDVVHQFRFGMPAVLFSNHNPGKDRVEGIIAYQGGDRLRLTLKTDELPDWASDGKLGVELLFDNNSYEEMRAALKLASSDNENSEFRPMLEVLLGKRPATFRTGTISFISRDLNESQQLAVEQILNANEIAVVHGPPGTGKTTTLVQAITGLIRQGNDQILVVAPSNTAVDLLSEKLSAEGLNVLRIGNPARVSTQLTTLTLDYKLTEHKSMKEVRNLKKRAAEFKGMAHKYKRNFGRAEKEQRKALFDEAHKIMKEADRTEQYITDQLLSEAQVIAATLVGANHYVLKGRKYDTVVIDEAGQALEPACWIPLVKAKKAVFAGDHCQLPPTIKSVTAAKKGLNITLLEKTAVLHPKAVTMLDEQYRMNEVIMGYPSATFYQDRLKANPLIAGHLLSENDQPLVFIDTAGCGFEEKSEGTSTVNPEEALFLLKHLEQMITNLASGQDFTSPAVAVISPYKQQVQLLKEMLQDHPGLANYAQSIAINTIDSFQGQEKDVVYISLVRSNTDGSIGFLSDTRRMNVAMTRARKKLVVIGDSATLGRTPFYSEFIAYAERHSAYHSAWEFMGI